MSTLQMRFGAVCLAIGLVLVGGNQLAAQDLASASSLQLPVLERGVTAALSRPVATARPSILIPLYISFGAMQVLDLHSTQRALDSGNGREGNPVMGTAVGSPLAMTAMKIGATTGIILLSEKLWKRNRMATVVLMVAITSANAVIASHNYSIAR